MRMRWSRWAPLTVLAGALIALPIADLAIADADAPYRAPSRLTPGWEPANADKAVDYGNAGFVAYPPPTEAKARIDITEALRREDAFWKHDQYSRSAEIALRMVRLTPDPYGRRVGFDAWDEKKAHLAYVVITHNEPIAWFGGPMRDDPADRAKGPDPTKLCANVMLVDAVTGELMGSGATQVCRM